MQPKTLLLAQQLPKTLGGRTIKITLMERCSMLRVRPFLAAFVAYCGSVAAVAQPTNASQLTSADLLVKPFSVQVPPEKDLRELRGYFTEFVYPKMKEQQVLENVRKRNMPHLYRGFIAMFPKSSHRKDVEALMASNFFLLETGRAGLLTFDLLKDGCNFDGEAAIYRVDNGFVVLGEGDRMAVISLKTTTPRTAIPVQALAGQLLQGGNAAIGNVEVPPLVRLQRRGLEAPEGAQFVCQKKTPG